MGGVAVAARGQLLAEVGEGFDSFLWHMSRYKQEHSSKYIYAGLTVGPCCNSLI